MVSAARDLLPLVDETTREGLRPFAVPDGAICALVRMHLCYDQEATTYLDHNASPRCTHNTVTPKQSERTSFAMPLPHSTVLPDDIQEQATYERYGYRPQDLSPSSGRSIVVLCPLCGQERSIPAYKYRPNLRCATCFRHGQSCSTEYAVWVSMKSRCYNPADRYYHLYGGRGITVCSAWRVSFPSFLASVGPRPSAGHSIERIDNDGHYEPWNVRWASAQEQANNRRTNLHLVVGGRSQTLAEWCRELGLPYARVRLRLSRLGWTPEEALDLVPRKGVTHK